MKTHHVLSVAITALCLWVVVTTADVPHFINYQGTLTDSVGNPISGVRQMVFAIYPNETIPIPLWNETQPAVEITDGLFRAKLGSVTPVPSWLFTGDELWLGIRVSPDPTELLPRQPLVTVPYGFKAEEADHALQADTAHYSYSAGTASSASFAAQASNASHAIRADTAQFALTASPDNDWVISGNNIYRLTGNVGIGTASPGYKLYVEGQAISGVGSSASGSYSTVNGGQSNTATSDYATVGGGRYNRARGQYSVVSGGGGDLAADSNSASGDYSAIGGGRRNTASGQEATVGGGLSNDATSYDATVGGGSNNDAAGGYATVGGGNSNTAIGGAATVGGGWYNTANSTFASVGGGGYNHSRGQYSVIAGGGGYNPADSNSASGDYSAIGGGWRNTASGTYSAIPGGDSNVAQGSYSAAMGRQAQALHSGSFVWADGSGVNFASTASNQFLIRAAGGVGIGTTNPSQLLHVYGTSNPKILVEAPSSTTPELNLKRGTENYSIFMTSANDLAFFRNGTKVTFANNGNVGIGTTNPDVPLQIGNGTHTSVYPNPAMQIDYDDSYGHGIELRNNGGASLWSVDFDGGTTFGSNTANKDVLFLAGSSLAMTLQGSTRYVGIGTQYPTQLLHVTSSSYPKILLESYSGQAPEFDLKRGSTTFGLYINSGNDLVFSQAGDRVTFTDDGKVGIGTTNPSHQLTVNVTGSDDAMRLIGPDGIYGYGARLNFGDGDYVYLDEVTDDHLDIHALGIALTGGEVTVQLMNGTTSGNQVMWYDGKLYYYSSSRKYKDDIKPLEENFDKILDAEPVSFTDKVSGERNIGFIAEEFEKLGLENLVVHRDSKPDAIKYELVSLYLLEIIKKQNAKIEELTQRIDAIETNR